MAARQLQKLRAAAAEQPVLDEEASSSGSESPATSTKGPANAFDLLAAFEEDDAEQAAQAASREAALDDDEPEQQASASQTAANSGAANSTNKKRRKKKAGKAEAATSAEQQGLDEVDLALAELNMDQPSARQAPGAGASASLSSGPPLLGVDAKALRPDDEMRRIFGSRVVDAESKDRNTAGTEAAGLPRRYRRLMARGQLKRPQMQKGMLVTPRDTWPALTGGLTMEYFGEEHEEGQRLLCFEYVQSSSYQAVQRVFEQSQASMDPNRIVQILQQHPYHIDSLLTMYELYRSTGEQAYADEILERCLYALEMAWHPWFNPAGGNCRLDFEVEANRPLFTALFRYMQKLSRQGLHSTALELAKLLMALDPTDPMGVFCWIDYLALRAHRFGFLKRLLEEYPDRSLPLLPNMAFSSALGTWEAAQPGLAAAQRGSFGAASSSGRGLSNGHAAASADDARTLQEPLVNAILLHPLALVRLMDKARDQGAGKDADWSDILANPLFAKASDGGSASLSHLIDLFVERHHQLWKVTGVQAWLKEGCRAAIAAAADGKAANWDAVRADTFPPSSENMYGDLRLIDFSDRVAAIPQEEARAAMEQMGPAGGAQLPLDLSPEELESMRTEAERLLHEHTRPGGRQLTEEELQGANPLMMLLRSMLPWVNAPDGPVQDAAAAETNDGRESEDGPASE